MIMKGLFVLTAVFLLGISCVSVPPPADPLPVPAEPAPAAPVQEEPAPPPVEEQAPVPQHVPEPVFDPDSISQEQFDTTKNEVQTLVEDLNKIIRARNYNSWVTYLSESYFEEINSQAYLEDMTEKLYERDKNVAANLGRDVKQVQKRVLRTSRDYFTYVVVPSRANDRVDDIEYISENQVIAYTVDGRGQRLILHNLEKIDGKWKISN
jgi:hypothetical protein